MASNVQIKGIREGLLVTLRGDEWPEMRHSLMEQINQQADFLRGGKLVIDVENQALSAAELSSLRNEISDKGLSLWAVLGNSPKTTLAAQSLGLATRLAKPTPEHVLQTQHDAHSVEGAEAILVKKTLRSGNKLQHNGHIIVIGDVNPGAEIIAGGDVVVWGRLRGVVHAGAEGDENAVICALDLSPTQLRIAGKIALAPQRRGKSQPEIARIKNEQVVAETWNPKEK
jgi:septum site-determining protein MinC